MLVKSFVIKDGILYLISDDTYSEVLIINKISSIILNPPQIQKKSEKTNNTYMEIHCGGIIHKLSFRSQIIFSNIYSQLLSELKK